MANSSVLAAFERMWQHTIAKLSLKADSDHTHLYAGSSSEGGSANSAEKLETSRTIALDGQFQGSVSFDGSTDVTLNGQLRHCIAHAASDVSTDNWFKVADVVFDNVRYEDRVITFLVDNAYTNSQYGTLRIRVRVKENTLLENANIQWEYASSNINPADFVLTVTQDNTELTAELWCKITTKAYAYHFTVLHESRRNVDGSDWNLYDSNTGVASYTTGDNVTAVPSVFATLKNNISGNATTATIATTSTTAEQVKQILLTSEDLSTMYGTAYWGKTYYTAGGNTCTNKPKGVNAFNLSIGRAGNASTVHTLIDTTNKGYVWINIYEYGAWSGWTRTALLSEVPTITTRTWTAEDMEG